MALPNRSWNTCSRQNSSREFHSLPSFRNSCTLVVGATLVVSGAKFHCSFSRHASARLKRDRTILSIFALPSRQRLRLLVDFGERDHTNEQFRDPRKKARAMMAR